MFRAFSRKRGNADITPPVTKMASITFQVLKPVFQMSAFIGYAHPSYRVQGCVGGLVWLFLLLAHGAFDFLAARQLYTYGWASVSLSLVVLCFVCTMSSNRRILPWLEKGLCKLEEDGKYRKTLERFGKVFKVNTLGESVVLLYITTKGGKPLFERNSRLGSQSSSSTVKE